MNQIKRVLKSSQTANRQRQIRYYRKAFELISAAALHLREARRLKPWDLPEGAQDIFFHDVEDLLREARRYVRKGLRAQPR